MRAIAVLGLAVLMTGCATNANVQKIAGSAASKPPHNRDICFMRGKLPENIKAEFQGRGVSNSHWYGGYAGPKRVLADKGRASGVDVFTEMQHRQVIGFFAVVRPRVIGLAYSLEDPESFNCQEFGGETYGPYGLKVGAYTPATANGAPLDYDQCMARVMRINDPALRMQAMTACDGAK